MTKLVRRQSIPQLIAVELDEVSILRGEHVLALQQRVKGFAGANEIYSLFTNRKHAATPFDLTTFKSSWDDVQLVPEEPYKTQHQDGWRQYDEHVLDHLPIGIAWNTQGLHDGPPFMKVCAAR